RRSQDPGRRAAGDGLRHRPPDRGQRDRGRPREEPPRRVHDPRPGRDQEEGRDRPDDRQGEGRRGEARGRQGARRQRNPAGEPERREREAEEGQGLEERQLNMIRSITFVLASGLIASVAACGGTARGLEAYRTDTANLLETRNAQLQSCYDDALKSDAKAA